MARKSQEEENKPWKATTKFFPVKDLYRFQLKEGVYQNTEKGVLALVNPEFLTITKDGYTPQTEEEEKRLLTLSAKSGSYLIEYAKMPKSADAKVLESELIKERKEKEKVEDELEKLKTLARAAGIEV